MPDGIKTYGNLTDVGILSSEVYAVEITFGSPLFFLEAVLYALLDLCASRYP